MSEQHDRRIERIEDWKADATGRLTALEKLAETSEARLTEERRANAEERKANRTERTWAMGVYIVLVLAVISDPIIAKLL
ncbi:MAG: hypothetical protein ISN28_08330 [Ectothiorhodospiraceae bacterium AqS1]|nr:hypothetical protein [Ectothiorhodospiraceae bacterium AqS1]